MKILLVDDEKTILATLGDALEDAGYKVTRLADGAKALEAIRSIPIDVLITDLRLPGVDGMKLVRGLSEYRPEAVAMIITGYGSFDNAVDAMELGVRDFLTKPFLNEDIIARLKRIKELRALTSENIRLKRELTDRARLHDLIGHSEAMQELFDTIEKIAHNDFSVLITGESGTGKELVARALHYLSARKDKSLVPLSCATLPENLLEDELFGHEPGAFTDAKKRKTGRFEQADGGSIFLDDIDDMPLNIQVKLLRILQERRFERLGGVKTIEINVRVIAATKADLSKRVAAGLFREDLFYRLNVIPLKIPALRERIDDLPLLVEHFIEKYGGGKPFSLTPDTLRAMSGYSWPGNIRELENAVKRAIAMSGSEENTLNRRYLLAGTPQAEKAAGLSPESHQLTGVQSAVPKIGETGAFPKLREVVRLAETEYIRSALEHSGGNRTKTAELLGISRKNLWEKMKEYGIE